MSLTYLYENSNPDRFQQFCQSLLLPEYPGLQCFPVGQADGGRDGLAPGSARIVQVKFKRKDEVVNANWMISTLEKEKPKIERLHARGAESYLMVTNASMTSPLDVGSYDLVQNWIDENLPIPGQCLWRDDLDRRLDRAEPAFKLKYSELLAGDDAVGLVLQQMMGPTRQRQLRAVRAFVDYQYAKDELVKFKQLNMSNGLFDQFVDVSVKLGGSQTGRKGNTKQELAGLAEHFGWGNRDGESSWLPDPAVVGHMFDRMHLGAAAFLLSDAAQERAKRIVLQGAPGQGKSTLAQYVCQIQRAKYLGKEAMIARVPSSLSSSPFRIPIKVDLRDFAGYLNHDAPFTIDPTSDLSLEGFLAALVKKRAGGLPFAIEDLVEVISSTPTLLFLDGLDEVADMNHRQKLVNEIVDALNRFESYGSDVQVVVTSRPSVFGRAPSFAGAGFLTFRLDDLNSDQIKNYAERWVEARGLDEDEAEDVDNILAAKLKLSHIQDLTKNPMQLAILLSLIHSEGPSLPDQRTDLYQRYMDLFLIREAEKDEVVGGHKKLLIAFIQKLAWTLQSQAETAKASGAISVSELKAQFGLFLRESGNPDGLAEELFTRGLERIFVLVERIEGTFEFEVQPLREFFCAGHLFETSPFGAHLPKNARGDRAHRFEAMAKNPFWANVVRFYAGAWQSGEIPALVMSLKEVIRTGTASEGIQARRVGIALLTDWVFSSKKFAQRDLIDLIFDDVGIDLASSRATDSDPQLRLDAECGQDVLRSLLFEKLRASRSLDPRAGQICRLIKGNGGEKAVAEFLEALEGTEAAERSLWFGRMVLSGATKNLDPSVVWELLMADSPSPFEAANRVIRWLRACSQDAMSEPRAVVFIYDLALSGRFGISVSGDSILESFIRVLSVNRAVFDGFGGLLFGPPSIERPENSGPFEDSAAESAYQSIVEFHGDLAPIEEMAMDDPRWNHEPLPNLWPQLVEITRARFGDIWPTFIQASLAAGIASKDRGAVGSSLLDGGLPLVDRARAARLKRGGASWWSEQLRLARTPLELNFVLLMIAKWAPLPIVIELANEFDARVAELTTENFDLLETALFAQSRGDFRIDRTKDISLADIGLGGRAAHLLALGTNGRVAKVTFSAEQLEEPKLVEKLARDARRDYLRDVPAWSSSNSKLRPWFAAVEAAYARNEAIPNEAYLHLRRVAPTESLISAVMKSPNSFPVDLTSVIFETLDSKYRPQSVGRIAAAENWTYN